jgi:DNA-directed RNA polymerase specialized sigma24 family protein
MQTSAAGSQPSRDIEQTVTRAFRTAHLLTASTRQAESAVLEAIDSFDPDVDTAESLFQNAILAAVRCPSSESQSNESFEPLELQAVLNLSENLRRCFVLRVLLGFSRSACGRLLNMTVATVNEYTCAALQRLAGVDR